MTDTLVNTEVTLLDENITAEQFHSWVPGGDHGQDTFPGGELNNFGLIPNPDKLGFDPVVSPVAYAAYRRVAGVEPEYDMLNFMGAPEEVLRERFPDNPGVALLVEDPNNSDERAIIILMGDKRAEISEAWETGGLDGVVEYFTTAEDIDEQVGDVAALVTKLKG